MSVFLQYSSLAAQCSLSAQQNHPTLGQHPPGHTVPSQSCLTIFFGAAMEINFSAMLVFLQYSSLAAQYSSPGQQNHPTLGQHPPGHSVPGQSCLISLLTFTGAAMAIKILAKLVFLQYSSLAAQYSSPGQQNHPTFGQHPPGHSVPGQSCLTIFFGAAIDIKIFAKSAFLQYSSLAAQYSSPETTYNSIMKCDVDIRK